MSDEQRARVARMPLMRQLEERHRAGDDPAALEQAIQMCYWWRYPWPEWVESAVRGALEDHAVFNRPLAPFGPATLRKRQDAERNEALLQCYEQLAHLKRGGDLERCNLLETLTSFASAELGGPDFVSTVGKCLTAARRARRESDGPPPPTAILHVAALLSYLRDRRLIRAKNSPKMDRRIE